MPPRKKSSEAEKSFFQSSSREAPKTKKPLPDKVDTIVEDDRTGMSVAALRRAFSDHLFYHQGKLEEFATPYDHYMALSYTVRDRLVHRWLRTLETILAKNAKVVYYLSAEFLMGRQLGNNLLNAGMFRQALTALGESHLDLAEIIEQEPDPGLGNGGLGRLAACYLDSLATLNLPALGYGIRYEYGIFQQEIVGGWQQERPDKWLQYGNPWEIARPEVTYAVPFGGSVVDGSSGSSGRTRVWQPARVILGTPFDTMVPGFRTNMVNSLRLWAAQATKDFDFGVFNAGDYTRAVEEKTFSENISKVLYPNDNTAQGKELRLRQQFFFVSCSLQDILRLFSVKNKDLTKLASKATIQLNDTHPAIAVAELMRLLMDEHDMPWEKAWETTVQATGYTNHTLLPEALEKWPVGLFEWMLPRHLGIIYEVNRRFIEEVQARFPGDEQRVGRMSLIEEGEEKQVRMAHLATVGSKAVNGVAALHSQLVKDELLRDFYEMYPDKFHNVTNGVTPRRWLMLCNKKLTYLLTERLGKDWLLDLSKLKELEKLADDGGFQEIWRIFKEQEKDDLSGIIQATLGYKVDRSSMFDVQVKRIHEYKRQLLFALYIITQYHRLKDSPNEDFTPRTCIFGGKAAPGYFMAKLIIKLINDIAEVVNNDPQMSDKLKVVFLPNFSVSLGEQVYPAADLSEQISLAGKEASGTGNMKFALNGALTIGTLDGANIEIREAVGEENFFLFGKTVHEVREIKSHGYEPWRHYTEDDELRRAIDAIAGGHFSGGDNERFKPLVDSLLQRDEYLICADFRAYLNCQEEVSKTFQDESLWVRKSILNVARMGHFSSDRSIQDYTKNIWKVKPIDVVLKDYDPDTAVIGKTASSK